jgi:hypothetical protein
MAESESAAGQGCEFADLVQKVDMLIEQSNVGLLDSAAARYSHDARKEFAARNIYVAVAFIAFAATTAVLAWAATTFDAAQPISLFARFIVAVPPMAASLLFFRRAVWHNSTGLALQQLERNLEVIGPYLATMPDTAQHLLRGWHLPRFFPDRLNDDLGPLEVSELDADRILMAADPDIEIPAED